jgi:hypothetical protein
MVKQRPIKATCPESLMPMLWMPRSRVDRMWLQCTHCKQAVLVLKEKSRPVRWVVAEHDYIS